MKFFDRQSDQKFAAPAVLVGACLLMALQAGNLLLWGTRRPGPTFSDLLQLVMGVLCVVAANRALRASSGFGRYFWALCIVTFTLFVAAQGLASYNNLFGAPYFIQWTVNLLFFFWFTPLAMALFLDMDIAQKRFDWLQLLDLVQVILFWFAGYFYFFYLPEHSTGLELARTVWAPYFLFVGFLIAAYILRAFLVQSAPVRAMFLRVAAFLVASGIADYFYYYGPGKDLPNGTWFDFLWISVTFVFVALAATWTGDVAASEGYAADQARRSLMVQALPLLYSLLIVLICARIVQQRIVLAATVVLISLACSAVRLLVTQYRQQRVQQLLEAVIEGTDDAICVKDRDGRFLMLNSVAAERTGHAPGELSGRTCEAFLPAAAAVVIRERELVTQQIAENQTFEEQATTGSGNLTCLTTLGPFRDAQGKIAGTFSVSRDITDRKRMEENLRVQKLFLEQMIQSAPEAIAITDPDYTVRQVNLEFTRVFGYTQEEACGRNLGALIVPPHKEKESESLADYEARPANTVLETTRRRKDGSPVEVSVLVSPVIVGNELDAVYCIYRDISDRKTTEEQLRQSQKMEAIGRLAGGLAHDLNNLLTVIAGYSELQLAAFTPTDPKRTQAAKISHAAERATALTRQLLAFSRKQVLQPKAIDLNSVVGGLESLLRRLIGEDIEFRFTPCAEHATVLADPSQIEQVIMNLAINARDAMPKGGKLHLQTKNVNLDEAYARVHVGLLPGRYALLTVSDTGIGMDEETLAHVFEPFFTTKGLGKGTGLGLSTVYGIVQQSKGHVFVDSEPGRGTNFQIYLPYAAAPAVQPVNTEKPAQKGGRETILLVEDDPQVRELTATLLQGCGYEVLATDTMSGVESYCREFQGAIDLLLTDMIMPGMNGKEVAAAASRLRPGLRVVYMSGYTDDVIDHHGGLDPDTHFLQKPFSSAALAEKVRQALASVPKS